MRASSAEDDQARLRSRATLSGLEISVVVGELSSLKGAYLSNIYSEGEAQLLQLKKPEETETTVVVSPRFGGWISAKDRAVVHTETTEFTTALRSGLYRMRVEGVLQYGVDRVVILSFEARERRRKLVLELIPPGNIILLDENDKILVTLRDFVGPQRRIVKGQLYRGPPQNRIPPDSIDEAALALLLKRWHKAGEGLGRGISLPRKYVDEVLFRAGLSQGSPSTDAEQKAGDIVRAMKVVLEEVHDPHPCLVEREGYIEAMAIAPAYGKVLETKATMSALADELFSHLLAEQIAFDEDSERQEKAKELDSNIASLEQRRNSLLGEASRSKELAASVRQMVSEDEVRLALDSADLRLPDEVKRHLGSAPATVASRLFDYSKAQAEEAAKVEEAEEDFRRRMERELKGIVKQQRGPRTRKVANREWYEKFRWFHTSTGKLAIGGRDANSNTILVKRYLEDTDVVYHADLFGSPFFVLKGGAEQSEEEVAEMSVATVCFSSGWKTGLGAADAYWVLKDQVSQSAPSGEYLARGSFAIKGKKNYAPHNILQLAIGVEEKGRVISGPEQAVQRHAIGYVVLVPHREKASDTAKRVAVDLRKIAGEETSASISVDEVLRMLPAGGGKVIRKRQGKDAKVEEGKNENQSTV